MSNILALCDTEELYVKQLVQYICARQAIPLRVQAFTSAEALKSFAKLHEIELLLISAEAMEPELNSLPIKKIILLSDGGPVELSSDYPAVYKYQSGQSLVREVMEYYSAAFLPESFTVTRGAASMIGIYSPVKRCLKTSFALALGQVYAGRGRVLYINLEDFSGFRNLLKKEYPVDISDLLYFFREEKEGMLKRLEESVEQLGSLSYIPPAICPADMKSVLPQEWKEWFLLLLAKGPYQIILVDLGEGIQGGEDILSMCSKVYMPVKSDSISQAKIAEYEKYLNISGWEGLMRKMEKIKLPFSRAYRGEAFLEGGQHEELVEFARELVSGEEN